MRFPQLLWLVSVLDREPWLTSLGSTTAGGFWPGQCFSNCESGAHKDRCQPIMSAVTIPLPATGWGHTDYLLLTVAPSLLTALLCLSGSYKAPCAKLHSLFCGDAGLIEKLAWKPAKHHCLPSIPCLTFLLNLARFLTGHFWPLSSFSLKEKFQAHFRSKLFSLHTEFTGPYSAFFSPLSSLFPYSLNGRPLPFDIWFWIWRFLI